jgi:nicotinamide riboside kinase
MTSRETRYEIRDTKLDRTSQDKPLRVAVVGPCASGKSTLVEALREAGYDARHPAQEHSYVPDMWRRLVDPDVLVYLDLSHAAYRERRPKDDAGPEYLEMQRERLAHARAHAEVVVDTSGLTAEAVRELVLSELSALERCQK